MVLSWRKLKKTVMAGKKELLGVNSEMEVSIPTHFRCPISLDLMKDPVILSTGITYDRESIEKWIEAGNLTCPATNVVLTSLDQTPNHAIRKMIQDWCVQNRSHGVERIPTPRIPVTPYEVTELCSKIRVSAQREDEKKCRELVGKIKIWGRESERNKKCIISNGTGAVLAACFEHFAKISVGNYVEQLVDILSVLTWAFPLSVEGQSKLGSASSLQTLVFFLKGKDLSAKQNSVLILKQLLSIDQIYVDELGKIEGVAEALVNITKEPLSTTATKSSLTAIFYMILPSAATSQNMAVKFVELGLVSLLLDFLFDAEKRLSEKALVVLDGICDSKEGRQKVYEDALSMPVLVKKILRISDLATEVSISILWKLCRNGERDDQKGEVAVEALRVGAFQKLLVLLQIGCGESVKEKITELLKILNQYKDRLDCVDSSMDFKYLKKPF